MRRLGWQPRPPGCGDGIGGRVCPSRPHERARPQSDARWRLTGPVIATMVITARRSARARPKVGSSAPTRAALGPMPTVTVSDRPSVSESAPGANHPSEVQLPHCVTSMHLHARSGELNVDRRIAPSDEPANSAGSGPAYKASLSGLRRFRSGMHEMLVRKTGRGVANVWAKSTDQYRERAGNEHW